MLMTKKKRDQVAQSMAQMATKKSQFGEIWGRMVRNKLGMVGLVIVVILVILVAFAPVFARQDPAFQDFKAKLVLPNSEHLMGTDNYGRDLWARLLYGGRLSLLISLGATVIASAIGITLGGIAGYFGGKVDIIITRIADVVMAIPGLLLTIAVSTALGRGPVNTMLAISIGGIAPSLRIMRSTVLSIRSNDFVEAARATGSKHMRILFRHVLPNTVAPLIVNATLTIGSNIMAISGMSFIGLGVMPPTPEWGSILAAGKEFLRDFWPIIVFPALFLMATVFGFNLLGDALRDALDPRLKD